MTSLTEPVNLSEYFFVDEQLIAPLSGIDMNPSDEIIEQKYRAFRKNFPYLPPHLANDTSPLWMKLDEFLALNPSDVWPKKFTHDYELMYYSGSEELNKAIKVITDFAHVFFEELRTHNPKFVDVLPFLLRNINLLNTAHPTVITLAMPFFMMVYYIFQHWTNYSNKCFLCINYAILRKRSSLELEHIAISSDGRLFSSYMDYKAVIDSYTETKKQLPLLTSNDMVQTSFTDYLAKVISDLAKNNETMFAIFQNAIHEMKKSKRFPYHDKQYSFGYFDENGRFHYTGRMNALAFILDELELKGWSSCGDKVQLLLQHISFKGKGTTLKRNLESVVSNRADFTKASYHDEAVELINAIVKNCE